MISTTTNDIKTVIERYNGVSVLLIDLNDFEDNTICDDVLYLLEPSTLKLNKLIVLYDSNNTCLDGPVDKTFTENIGMRFISQGWNVILVEDGDSYEYKYRCKVNWQKRKRACRS